MTTTRIVSTEKIVFFQDTLLEWYKTNKRSFPWRNRSTSIYGLIISEIFLQRTRAETVSKFLPVFLKRFPSWKKLGEANETEIIKFLKPIGLHNQRGNRLFKLAQEIKKNNGQFPIKRSEILKLPMMGQYMTNAFELYVLNKNSPLIDVNMVRIFGRYFGPRKLSDIRLDSFLQQIAYRVVNHEQPKQLNWAILDYAALVCTVKEPKCLTCLLAQLCIKYNKNQTSIKPFEKL